MRFGGDMDTQWIESARDPKRRRPLSLFNAIAPWVLLLLPGALTMMFGPAMPGVFAPALDERGGMPGAMVAVVVLALATAATVLIAKRDHRWWVVIPVALAALIIANVLALWLGFQSLQPRVFYPGVASSDVWLPIAASYLIAGTHVYGWGGAALGVACGSAAAYQLGKWGEPRDHA
jgi:hypothetical protein